MLKKDINLYLLPEDYLLLICSKKEISYENRNLIISLVNSELNWNYIIKMGKLHGVMPLLYHNLNLICPQSIPIHSLNKLKENFKTNVKKNLVFNCELIKILKLLENNNILAIPYKGPILSHIIYDSLAFRQFNDIDILIDKSDALKVKQIMIKNGYKFFNSLPINDAYYLKFFTEYQFINKKNGSVIEIKWQFAGDFFSFPTNPNFLLDDLEKFDLNGLEINNLNPVNQLLILCIHAGKHFWNKLLWICDISEFIQKEKIDWDELLKKAEKLGVKRIVLVNLYLANDLFKSEIPNLIINQINLDNYVFLLSKQVKIRIFSSKKSKLDLFERLLFEIKKRENILDGIHDWKNLLTHPTYHDFNDIPLKKSLYPLYYLLRPFLLLKRYLRNSY